MKEKIISIALIIIIVLFVPVFITTILNGVSKVSNPARSDESSIMVMAISNSGEQKINLDDYLIGVVAAEMPINFEEEALKAQAVAARTYTLKKYNEDHQHVFTWPEQAYKSKEELEELWGTDNFPTYYNKIRRAVMDTDNEVVVFNEELIDAVFHSTSAGKTRSAEDVWGKEVPYLISVDSTGDVSSPKYLHSILLSQEELIEKIRAYESDFNVYSDNILNEIQIIKRAPEGYVLKIQIGNKLLDGETFRSYLDLPSSNFTLNIVDNQLEIDCKGYGHGVGMSQYGANYLAAQGYNYKEILNYYYSGTQILKIE